MTTVEDVEKCKTCNNMSFHSVFDTRTSLYSGFCLACGYSEEEHIKKGKLYVRTSGGCGIIEIAPDPDTGTHNLQAIRPKTTRAKLAKDLVCFKSKKQNATIVRVTFLGIDGLEFLIGAADPAWVGGEDTFDPSLLKVNVTRPGEGITLNAGLQDYLLDDQGNPMMFDSEADSRAWLKEHNVSENEIETYEFPLADGANAMPAKEG